MASHDLTLPELSKSSLPTLPTREFAVLVDRLHNRVETTPAGRLEICSAVAPSADERMVLVARADALAVFLTRSREDEVERCVAALLLPFQSKDSSDPNTMRQLVRQYALALAHFPIWAIVDVCRRVRDGTAGVNPDFRPTTARLADLCRDVVAPFLDERSKVMAVLRAEVYTLPTEEECERIRVGFEALADELRAGGRRGSEPSESPQTALQRLAAEYGVDLSKIPDRVLSTPRMSGVVAASALAAELRSARTCETKDCENHDGISDGSSGSARGGERAPGSGDERGLGSGADRAPAQARAISA